MVKSLKIILKLNESTGINWCVMPMFTTKSMYQFLMMQVVAVEYQFQVLHLNKPVNHLYMQSTSLIIGFNTLNSVMIHRINIYKRKMGELFKTISESLLPKKYVGYKTKNHKNIKSVGGEN